MTPQYIRIIDHRDFIAVSDLGRFRVHLNPTPRPSFLNIRMKMK